MPSWHSPAGRDRQAGAALAVLPCEPIGVSSVEQRPLLLFHRAAHRKTSRIGVGMQSRPPHQAEVLVKRDPWSPRCCASSSARGGAEGALGGGPVVTVTGRPAPPRAGPAVRRADVVDTDGFWFAGARPGSVYMGVGAVGADIAPCASPSSWGGVERISCAPLSESGSIPLARTRAGVRHGLGGHAGAPSWCGARSAPWGSCARHPEPLCRALGEWPAGDSETARDSR